MAGPGGRVDRTVSGAGRSRSSVDYERGRAAGVSETAAYLDIFGPGSGCGEQSVYPAAFQGVCDVAGPGGRVDRTVSGAGRLRSGVDYDRGRAAGVSEPAVHLARAGLGHSAAAREHAGKN